MWLSLPVEGHRGLVAEASARNGGEACCGTPSAPYGTMASQLNRRCHLSGAARPIVMPRPDRRSCRSKTCTHANAHEREREEADAARAVGDAGKARPLYRGGRFHAASTAAKAPRHQPRHHCPLEVPERLVVVDPRRSPPGEPRADLYCAGRRQAARRALFCIAVVPEVCLIKVRLSQRRTSDCRALSCARCVASGRRVLLGYVTAASLCRRMP